MHNIPSRCRRYSRMSANQEYEDSTPTSDLGAIFAFSFFSSCDIRVAHCHRLALAKTYWFNGRIFVWVWKTLAKLAGAAVLLFWPEPDWIWILIFLTYPDNFRIFIQDIFFDIYIVAYKSFLILLMFGSGFGIGSKPRRTDLLIFSLVDKSRYFVPGMRPKYVSATIYEYLEEKCG